MRVVLLEEDPAVESLLTEYEETSYTSVFGSGIIPAKPAIALVDFGQGYAYAGIVEKTRRVATRKDATRHSRLLSIDPVVTTTDLEDALPAGFSRHLRSGLLPEKTGEAVILALGRLRPDLESGLWQLLEATSIRPIAGEAGVVMAQEKDALALALTFFGTDRTPLTRWEAPTGEQTETPSFLAGLGASMLREDPMVNHDLGAFGDWDVVMRSAVGAVEFREGGRRLTVVNVNRTAIEAVLGVDLIYLNEQYNAFVLVQYKRMTKSESLGWIYRPDGNHDAEVERMLKIPADPADPVDSFNFRLDPDACYFKLCESAVLDPTSRELLKGMYLPLGYMLAAEQTARGPRGGRAFGYQTVPRHLNNTQFVQLVQDGWIGSAGAISNQLRDFVEDRLKGGSSVVLAFADKGPPDAPRHR